jgi:hypothetical protein
LYAFKDTAVLLKVVDGIESMAVEEEAAVVVAAGPTTVTVESGAFTVSSTVGQVITIYKTAL